MCKKQLLIKNISCLKINPQIISNTWCHIIMECAKNSIRLTHRDSVSFTWFSCFIRKQKRTCCEFHVTERFVARFPNKFPKRQINSILAKNEMQQSNTKAVANEHIFYHYSTQHYSSDRVFGFVSISIRIDWKCVWTHTKLMDTRCHTGAHEWACPWWMLLPGPSMRTLIINFLNQMRQVWLCFFLLFSSFSLFCAKCHTMKLIITTCE